MFTKIIKECKTDFQPVSNSINLPQQQELFTSFGNSNSHIKMGLFYEMLTAALFGGKLTDSLLRQDTHRKQGGPMPDVWSKRKNEMYESKALRNGHQLNLLDEQVNLYHKFQIIQPNTKISYTIWRHQFKNIKKYKGTHENLFTQLSQKTIAGIILPFSIIIYLHGIGEKVRQNILEKHKINLCRYEEDSWPNCTRISSKLLNLFLLKTEETINMIQLRSEDYVWDKCILPLIKINDNEIKPFPFVVIKDKSHKKWSDEFTNEIPF